MSPTPNLAQSGNDADQQDRHYELRLFIAGASTNSRHAVANLKGLCDAHLAGRYSLEIIDIHQQKEFAESAQIIAVPLLIKSFPLPERRLIGDMSDTRKVLKGLGISL